MQNTSQARYCNHSFLATEKKKTRRRPCNIVYSDLHNSNFSLHCLSIKLNSPLRSHNFLLALSLALSGGHRDVRTWALASMKSVKDNMLEYMNYRKSLVHVEMLIEHLVMTNGRNYMKNT